MTERAITRSLILLALFAASARASGTFTVISPGQAYDVSGDGKVVTGVDSFGAFTWTAAGGIASLGPANSNFGINYDGSVVAGTVTDFSGINSAGRFTTATGWVALGSFLGAGPCGFDLSSSYETNYDGSIVVGLGWNGCQARAFKWTQATGVVQLQGLVNTDTTRANSITGDGRYIGGWETVGAANPRRAALWGASGPPTLILVGTGNAQGAGEILDMNKDGSVVCGISNNAANQAFVWTKTGGVTLIPKLPGATIAYGQAVSDDGCVVFGSGGAFNGNPWVWTPAGGTQTLANFLTAQGISGWTTGLLGNATGMSADGRVLCGYGGGQAWVIEWNRPLVWQDHGGAIAGSTGKPSLVGYGCLLDGKDVGLSLTGAKPNAPVTLILGAGLANLPLYFGLLVPTPNIVLPGLATNAKGELAFSSPWPSGVPSGITIYFQEFITDPAAQFGVGASNGLSATTP